MLHDARDRAKAAGAKNIEDRPIKDGPVHYDADFETAATVLTFQHYWVIPRGSV
jgi:hypothetical protein